MDNSDNIEKENDLQRERKFLRNVMTTIPDSLLILDRELRVKYANRSFYKLFQIKPGEIIDRKITDILGDKDIKLSTTLGGLFGTKATLENFELHYQSEKLGERTFNITARGIILAEEEEEEEEEVLVVIYDITERKRTEVALRESEDKWRSLVENTPVGILISSVDGRIIELNNTIVQMFGYVSKEEFAKSSVS